MLVADRQLVCKVLNARCCCNCYKVFLVSLTLTGRGKILPNACTMLSTTFPPKLWPMMMFGNSLSCDKRASTSPPAPITSRAPVAEGRCADSPWHGRSIRTTCHVGKSCTFWYTNSWLAWDARDLLLMYTARLGQCVPHVCSCYCTSWVKIVRSTGSMLWVLLARLTLYALLVPCVYYSTQVDIESASKRSATSLRGALIYCLMWHLINY